MVQKMPIATSEKEAEKPDVWSILKKSAQRAGQGGLAGAAAMAINVCSLMWIRTTVNYQYRFGTSTTEAFKAIYAQGGIPRFYRGLLPALVQGPLSRFGDTAANTGTLVALDSFDTTKNLPMGIKTVAASVAAALFRIVLMPVDTFKTTLQVSGKEGLSQIFAKFKVKGPSVFWYGSLAAASATFVGHYPWFFTYNLLDEKLPKYEDRLSKLARSAVIGFCASAISDTCSNSIRVIKVYKQANEEAITYPQALKRVLAEDGVMGLLGRGLKTKIIANGLQGLMFSVLWKYIDELLFKKDKKSNGNH